MNKAQYLRERTLQRHRNGSAPVPRLPAARPPVVPCAYLGAPTGEQVLCPTCSGNVRLKVFGCSIYHTCTTSRAVSEYQCCQGCRSYTPEGALMARRSLRWSYGVTTTPHRRDTLLPQTLASLRSGGFPEPHLFVDGAWDGASWKSQFPTLRFTLHNPAVRVAGNWILALWELYLLDPAAERFAVFQDDLVCSRNLRAYLEACPYPDKAYLNLYTFPSNQELAPPEGGWYEARTLNPDTTKQTGRSALALVFSREAVFTLLSQRSLLERAQDVHRGWKRIDGGIVTAMNAAGWREYVHSPSLVQHTGSVSTCGNLPHPRAVSFKGEEFDLLTLLERVKV